MGVLAVLKRTQGGAELDLQNVSEPKPEADELVIKNIAVGISELDVITREQLIGGIFRNDQIVVGYEGVGQVLSVGEKVSGFEPGQKVAYLSPYAGTCSTYVRAKVEHVVALPDYMQDKLGASIFLRGVLAHALTVRTFIVCDPIKALVHEVGTATGQIVAQFAKARGASMVIGTISQDTQKKEAGATGVCDEIINYHDEDIIQKIGKATGGQGVHVVYDAVGSPYILQHSINALSNFGMLVMYNASVFNIQNLPVLEMAKKSLFASFPVVFQHKQNHKELILSAQDVFEFARTGLLRINATEFHVSKLKEALNAVADAKVPDSIIITF